MEITGPGFLDHIVGAFIAAFQLGFHRLNVYTGPILYAMGGIAWLLAGIGMLGSGLSLPRALANTLWLLVGMIAHVYITHNVYAMANAVFRMFAGFGAAVTGGTFTADNFLTPSTLFGLGFVVAKPVIDFLTHFTGWAALGSFHIILIVVLFVLAPIVVAFWWVAKDVVVTILEFHFAVMVAPVLVPWGILSHTAFLAEFAISWLLGCCVRIFFTAAILGIGVPLFERITPQLSPAGHDPLLMPSLVMAGSAVIFAIMASQTAALARTIAGRGMSLGLPGAMLVPSGGTMAYAARGVDAMARQAVRVIGGGAGVGRRRPTGFGRISTRQ